MQIRPRNAERLFQHPSAAASPPEPFVGRCFEQIKRGRICADGARSVVLGACEAQHAVIAMAGECTEVAVVVEEVPHLSCKPKRQRDAEYENEKEEGRHFVRREDASQTNRSRREESVHVTAVRAKAQG